MIPLIVVESPNKAKKIKEMFAGRYEVRATFGHICDLPDNPSTGIGIDKSTLNGNYALTQNSSRAVDGKRVIDGMRAYLKKNPDTLVYLATDDDREGESIAAFIVKYLKLPPTTPRIRFNAITQEKIELALATPGSIDWDMVASREARRLIDRIIGYSVSPLLQSRFKSRQISAGRVQTAVEALIIERERKIRNHHTENYYSVEVNLGNFRAEWVIENSSDSTVKSKTNSDFDIDKQELKCTDLKLATLAASFKSLLVLSSESGTVIKLPPSPLNTFGLIQMANKLFDWDATKTMRVAQSLFEGDGSGHGHITYHRTDSLNIDPAIAQEMQDWLYENNYPVADAINTWKPKNKQAQEAHEAIRPTYFKVEQAGEDADQQKLYALIRKRALFSQLAPAIYTVYKLLLADAARQTYKFKSTAYKLDDAGWKEHANMQSEEFRLDESSADEVDQAGTLPVLSRNTLVNVQSSKVNTHQTKAPPRYTLNTLTSKLESLSIGRPATIATVLDSFKHKKSIEIRNNKLHATMLSEQCYNLIYPTLAFSHIGYTAELEAALDLIADAKLDSLQLIRKVWDRLDLDSSKFSTRDATERG